jgi:hypothetical protein
LSKIEVDTIDKQSGSTLTLGGSGTAVTLASGATQTGFGRTGTVDWNTTPKTATFTAVSGDGFFANTSGGAFNMNLPAGSAGAIVSVADYAETFDSNNLTIVPNGSDKIGSLNENATLDVKGQSVTFIFVDSTQGWINTMDSTSNVRGAPPFICASVSGSGNAITTSGNCKIATFTGPGTFTVNSAAGSAANNVVSYVVVAGGAGGGTGSNVGGQIGGGGGGAGGYREAKSPVTPYTASPLDGYPSAPNRITVSATGFPITVGGGGAGGAQPGPFSAGFPGVVGGNSTFSSITSAGGGKGAAGGPGPNGVGGNGGSGGGAGATNAAGGTGNTPPVSPAQGKNGGCGSNDAGGGGGGATANASSSSPNNGGDGGAGATSSINATPTARAGGGGGGAPTDKGDGGTGGGGAGRESSNGPGSAGTVNTGGGGGGAISSSNCVPTAGGAGGSGIVIIRYKFQ